MLCTQHSNTRLRPIRTVVALVSRASLPLTIYICICIVVTLASYVMWCDVIHTMNENQIECEQWYVSAHFLGSNVNAHHLNVLYQILNMYIYIYTFFYYKYDEVNYTFIAEFKSFFLAFIMCARIHHQHQYSTWNWQRESAKMK